MRDSLAATGRPIVFSMCSWGHGQPWLWGQQVGWAGLGWVRGWARRAAWQPGPPLPPGGPGRRSTPPPPPPPPLQVGNSWRTSADVFAVWDQEQAKRLKLPGFLGICFCSYT
jgi:alpha-galactosidase